MLLIVQNNNIKRWMMFVLSIKVLKLLRSTILFIAQKTLENSEGVIKNEQFRETGNKGYTRRRQTKQNTTQYVLDTTMRKQTQIT
jgi:hypothetical protein